MRKYIYKDIYEQGIGTFSGKLCYKHPTELAIYQNVNHKLIENFNKVAHWIEENCPHLNGKFDCNHNPYYWISLVVEDGKAYLEVGSHGYGFDTALSASDTAVFSRGSQQSIPYAFEVQFFPNKRLEEFLKQWGNIKLSVKAEYDKQSYVFSDEFEP